MDDSNKIMAVRFFQTISGNEPVREWLHNLPKEVKWTIGKDLMTLEYLYPMGMPLVRYIEKDLWEVRSNLPDKTIGRVIYTIDNGYAVLLHGFIKKTKKISSKDLNIARARKNIYHQEVEL